MKASSVLDRAEFQLSDAGFTRWTKPELLLYLSEGQREAARLRPDSTAKTEAIKLSLGETRHNLPANAGVLIKITRNMGETGVTPGRTITIMDTMTLDRVDPKRHESNGKTRIKHYSYEEINPLEFESYPKSSASVDVYVEAIYSQMATDLTDETDELTVIDKYVNALTEYVMFRAYGKDAQYAGQDGRSNKHFSLFQAGLGLKNQTDNRGQ